MKIRIEAVQFGATGTKEENIDKARGFLESLVQAPTRPHFVCLPEMFTYLPALEDNFEAIDRIAEESDGPVAEMFSEYAKKLGSYIVSGSYIQRIGGKHYNTSQLFGPDGELLTSYDKTHLFDIPDFRESDYVTPGNRTVVFETEYCKIGMIICYDVRFPELLRTLTLKGAELIFCPAAFPVANVSPGADHWRILTQAAALHNMVYLTAVNQIGIQHGFTYFGRSAIVDPWGIEIAKAPNRECTFGAEIDLEYIREMRIQRRVLDHRRPDLYEL